MSKSKRREEDPMARDVVRRKRRLVRRVFADMGRDPDEVFDPWARLDAKAARGLDISVEARYLESQGIQRRPAPPGAEV